MILELIWGGLSFPIWNPFWTPKNWRLKCKLRWNGIFFRVLNSCGKLKLKLRWETRLLNTSHDPSSSAVASVMVQKYRPSSSQPTMYSGNPTSDPFLRHEKGSRRGLETEIHLHFEILHSRHNLAQGLFQNIANGESWFSFEKNQFLTS